MRGKYKPGQRLPSTLKLAAEMSVSLVTMHRAMRDLVATGMLRRGQGRGTLVHEDFAGRSLKTQGLRIGLLSHPELCLSDWAHAQIAAGVRQRARDLGIDLVLLRSDDDNRKECDGYLRIEPSQEQMSRPIRFGKASETPNAPLRVVNIGGPAGAGDHGVVRIDNTELGRQAYASLIALGHRRLGFVGGGEKASDAADLWDGFVEAVPARSAKGLVASSVRQGIWRLEESGVERLAELLRSSDHPTAIFAGGYEYALSIYDAARRGGPEILRDVSVIGVDDPTSAKHLGPPLTTFRRPLLELGGLAVSELTELIARRGKDPRQVTLRGNLVQRDSTSSMSS